MTTRHGGLLLAGLAGLAVAGCSIGHEHVQSAPAPVHRARPAPAPKRAPPPAPPKPKPAPPVPPATAANPAAARQLRTAGLAALNRGAADRAVALLRRAAQLDPGNTAISGDLARAERIAATVHARR